MSATATAAADTKLPAPLQCRACSEEGAEYELVALFSGSAQLARIYGTCIGLQCAADDGLPGHLCAGCNAKLVGFNKFRERCLLWDTNFRALLPPPPPPPPAQPPDEKAATGAASSRPVKVERSDLLEFGEKAVHLAGEYPTDTDECHKQEQEHGEEEEEEEEEAHMTEILPVDDEEEGEEEEGEEEEAEASSEDEHQHHDNDTTAADDDDDDNKSQFYPLADGPQLRPSSSPQPPAASSRHPHTDLLTRRSLKCPLCSRGFYKQQRYDQHMREHAKPVACGRSGCGRQFVSPAALRAHEAKAHQRRMRGGAGAVEGEVELLVEEQQQQQLEEREDDGDDGDDGAEADVRHKGQRGRSAAPAASAGTSARWVCDQCGKQFNSNGALKKHGYVHSGEMPYACSFCPKRCVTRHKLKEHTMRHEGVKNHVCPYCGMRKTTAHELKVHINYHTREKRWECEHCPLVFTSIGNKTRHVRIVHKGIKAFVCEHCQRSFGKAETLKHHEMTHTGERPHGCGVCGKRFIQAVALKTHQRVHVKRGELVLAVTGSGGGGGGAEAGLELEMDEEQEVVMAEDGEDGQQVEGEMDEEEEEEEAGEVLVVDEGRDACFAETG